MSKSKRVKGLSDLPTEIIHLVAEQIIYARSLNAFAQTSRHFYQICNSHLYARDSRRKKRRPAIVWAAERGREDTMCMALKYHNPLKKIAPLFVAVENNQDRIVQILLEKEGINIDAVNKAMCTPLEIAVQKGYTLIVKQLLDAGASVKLRRARMSQPHWLRESLLFQAIRKGHQDTARLLLKSGQFDVNDGPYVWDGYVLTLAIRTHQNEIIEDLIVAGADLSPRQPALVVATMYNNSFAARLLLHYGAEPNECYSVGGRRTPLVSAIMSAVPDTLDVLVDCDRVNVNQADSLNQTPLTFAIDRDQPCLAQLLLRRTDLDVNLANPFPRAIRKRYTDLARNLLVTGRLNRQSLTEGFTAAVETNNLDITLLLLDRKEVDGNSEHAFRRAIERGHVIVARALLAHGRLNHDSKMEGVAAAITLNEASTNMFIQAILDSGLDLSGNDEIQTLLEQGYADRIGEAVT
ncbi:ankyrin repeat-containing domain protein [Aspergillus crustosus]